VKSTSHPVNSARQIFQRDWQSFTGHCGKALFHLFIHNDRVIINSPKIIYKGIVLSFKYIPCKVIFFKQTFSSRIEPSKSFSEIIKNKNGYLNLNIIFPYRINISFA